MLKSQSGRSDLDRQPALFGFTLQIRSITIPLFDQRQAMSGTRNFVPVLDRTLLLTPAQTFFDTGPESRLHRLSHAQGPLTIGWMDASCSLTSFEFFSCGTIRQV